MPNHNNAIRIPSKHFILKAKCTTNIYEQQSSDRKNQVKKQGQDHAHRDNAPKVEEAMFSDRTIGLLTVASAAAVANSYYIQPLLVEIGNALSISKGLVGVLPGLSQIGLACGLAFLLPLGDNISARRLLLTVIPIQILALVLFAIGGSATTVAIASLLIGFFGIAPYILPPYVSLHVPSPRLGHVTGLLTRGIIIGILLARTFSGLIGTHFGWRTVYWTASVVMAIELIFLARIVKDEPPKNSSTRMAYWELIRSLLHLIRTIPELRVASICQALNYGSFMVFWIGVTLYLQSPAFGWTPQAIGLIALVAAAAASTAPIFGRAIDRSGPHATRKVALTGMVVAWGLLAVFKGNLIGMTVGLIVLDISATIVDISNRTILYRLDAGIRTRLNAIYQVAMFSGGACMSVLVGICWSAGGWLAVCTLGAIPVLIALLRGWRHPR
ncbi:MFS transporter [Duganella sp. FT94W]|uniref:MFS transporter n=1 Tax=Duganella lactea TaxID=2692173 RepID=A0ABW9V484_9BURK|nr:MFS transporter [Duganella lactea]MYM33736.1 MFS transporter [Duganella lactea]